MSGGLFGGMELKSPPAGCGGFAFMAQEEADTDTDPQMQTGFSFMSSPPPSSTSDEQGPMMGDPIASGEIKLAKTSAKAAVKKKRKTARVGFDRDDDGGQDTAEDELGVEPVASPPPPSVAPRTIIEDLDLEQQEDEQEQGKVEEKEMEETKEVELPLPSSLRAPSLAEPSEEYIYAESRAAAARAQEREREKEREREREQDALQAVAQVVNQGASVLNGVMNMFRGKTATGPNESGSGNGDAAEKAPEKEKVDSSRGQVSMPTRRDLDSSTPAPTPAVPPAAVPIPVPVSVPVPVPVNTSIPSPAPAPAPASAPAPAPKPPLGPTPSGSGSSPKAQSESALAAFESGSRASSQRIAEIGAQIRQAKLDRAAREQSVSQLERRLLDTEVEQAQLAAAEDFERADGLTGRMTSLRADILEAAEAVKVLGSLCGALEGQLAEAIAGQQAALADLLELLEVLRRQHQGEHDRAAREMEQRRALRLERLRTEQERLLLERKHIGRDEAALDDETATTEEAIASQLGDVQRSRDELAGQRTALLDEIAALEARLSEKRDEYRGVQAELDAADSRIGDVRKRYDRQLQRLQDRRTALQTTRSECLQEEQATAAELEEVERETQAFAISIGEMDAWCNDVDREIATGTILRETHSASWSTGARNVSVLLLSDSNLQLAVDDARSALLHALAEQEETQLALDLLVAEGRELEERAPKVDADKKAHAAARRFKEAAQAAKELKEVQVRREEVESAANDTRARVELVGESVARATERQQAALESLLEAQKEADKVRFAALGARAQQLRGALHQIESASGESVLARVAIVLVGAELEGVINEAAVIRDTHGLPDSLSDQETAADTSAPFEETPEPNVDAAVVCITEALPATREAELDDEVQSVSQPGAGMEEEVLVASIDVTADEVSSTSPSPRQLSNTGCMLEARALLLQIDALEAAITESTLLEDYERAGELEDEGVLLQADVQLRLGVLGCTLDDVRRAGFQPE